MSTSRVTEVDAVSRRANGAFKTTTLSSDPYLAGMFSTLDPLSTSLSASINRIKPDSTLEEADEKRDGDVRSLNFLLMGLSHHPSKKIKDAALLLLAIFEKYGLSIIGESYAIESSLITSLLNDLAAPELQDAIAAVPGCAAIIMAVQTSQAEFESTRIAWEQEKAEEGTKLNASELKAEVLAIINEKIVVYMRAMEIVAPDTHGAFARTLAQIIADNNEVVKKRRKKAPKPEVD